MGWGPGVGFGTVNSAARIHRPAPSRVSIRRRTERGFASIRARAEREPHLLRHGAGFVFYALVDALVDRYFPVLDTLESELEKIEANIFMRNTARSNIEALYALKQKLMILKHAVDPLLEVLRSGQQRVGHRAGLIEFPFPRMARLRVGAYAAFYNAASRNYEWIRRLLPAGVEKQLKTWINGRRYE